jgi:excisionase family DNA binding protein
MFCHLIVGAEREERGRQGVVDLQPSGLGGDLLGGLAAVVGDDDGLDEGVELEVFGALARLLGDESDGGVETLGFPADGVGVPVGEGLPEHGEADDVGVECRVGEGGATVHADQDRHVLLFWSGRGEAGQVVVPAVMVDPFAVEQTAEDLDRLGEATLAQRRRIEADPCRLVFGEGVARPYSHLEAAAREAIQGGEALGQEPGMMEIVVQHERAEPDPFRPRGSEREGLERGQVSTEVIEGAHHVEACLLDRLHLPAELLRAVGPDLIAEAERSHTVKISASYQASNSLCSGFVPEPRAALFVRIPAAQARQLDSRARALGRTKQDVVADLLAASFTSGVMPPVDQSPLGAPDDVLTLDELADLLKLDPDTVLVRVDAGELPGRRFGDQWRFSRRAVLAWLDGSDTPERTPPGFGPSPRAHPDSDEHER